MQKPETPSLFGDVACGVVAVLFLAGLAVLAVRLASVQIEGAAGYSYANARQSERRLQTAGPRGRLLDRHGRVLAGNRPAVSIACSATFFQRRTWSATTAAITGAIARVATAIGRPVPLTAEDVARHVRIRLSRPLVVWAGATPREVAVLSEQQDRFPGFVCIPTEERTYPGGRLAAHILGYVGRTQTESPDGDENFTFRERELRGREGLERVYDDLLRGVSGERRIQVDARGFATAEWTVTAAHRGLDLALTLDRDIQSAAERALAGLRGACVVLDPRNGEILAMASAPSYDLANFVPSLSAANYRRLTEDPAKPLLNRAAGGCYAPGSTFKIVTALAGLSLGVPPEAQYECIGIYERGGLSLRCTSRWGHGPLDLRHALMRSCNPYFCNLGQEAGTNALSRMARTLGLGQKTGVDLLCERAGLVPDAGWKEENWHEPWRSADLSQMAIGQGMLLVTPLQMARLVGAVATGNLVTPHFRLGAPVESTPLPISAADLKIVREGMRLVVTGDDSGRGTGWRGGEDVPVSVAGKTGTAEVGARRNRHKNVWFVAYAPVTNPTVAVSLVVEHGESGGGTAAPRVANVLREVFR